MDNAETELKLQLDAAAVAKLRRLRWLRDLRLAPAVTQRQSSAYFDTPDLRLRRAGIATRIRTIGSRRVQTVKMAAEPGSLTRSEWEHVTDRTVPDLTDLGDNAAAPLLAGIATEQLQPVFRADVHRTAYRLGKADWLVEMVIDVGDIVAGQARLPISEVEFELLSGQPRHLYALAAELAARLPVRMRLDSKADRGYALLAGAPPVPSKWRPPRLSETATVADTFRKMARSCLAHLLANEACLSGSGDPEAIHQIRVALRRLRSIVAVFRPALSPETAAAIDAEMKWLLRQLGPARDTDVFIAEILAPVAARRPQDDGVQRLLEDFEARKERHYHDAQSALASARCAQLFIGIGAWIEDDANNADGTAASGAAAAEFARTVLDRRHRKLRKAGRNLADMTPGDRHRIRILVKKLRYAAEFFAGLFADKRTRRYATALADLQDRLGELNDVAVAQSLLEEIGRDAEQVERHWAAGLVTGWHIQLSGGQLDAAAKAWSHYQERARFWR